MPATQGNSTEDFLILAGTQQVLTQGPQSLEWTDAHPGDYIHLPGGTLHAHRNVSQDPVIDLIITTARLGQFFQEVGRPATGSSQPPSPDEIARFPPYGECKYNGVTSETEETPDDRRDDGRDRRAGWPVGG